MKCQLTYLPFATEEVSKEAGNVIDFIDGCDLDYKVGELSKLLVGDREEIFDLIGDIYSTQNDDGHQFDLHIELLSLNNYS